VEVDVGPHGGAQLEAVHPGHAHVRDDQVGPEVAGLGQPLQAVLGLVELDLPAHQVDLDQGEQRSGVVDQQDLHP